MRLGRDGLSLLESALAISIVGSLLAVLVPTFVRSLHTSKTGEAVTNLAELHDRAAAYFEARHDDGSIARRWCLPDEAGPTPRVPSADPIEFDFRAETVEGHETWSALSFSPRRTRFRYSFIPESAGCGIRRPAHMPVATFVAEADLDLDGQRSRFERAASVSVEGQLVPEGALRADAPVE